MSTTPTVVAVVSGADGYTTAYVSFKDIVNTYGALTELPELNVAVPDANRISATDPSISFAGTVNDTPYAAGQMLTFKVTSLGLPTSRRIVYVDITYACSNTLKDTTRVAIELLPFTTS